MNRRSFFRQALGFTAACVIAPLVAVGKLAAKPCSLVHWKLGTFNTRSASVYVVVPNELLGGCYTAPLTFTGPYNVEEDPSAQFFKAVIGKWEPSTDA